MKSHPLPSLRWSSGSLLAFVLLPVHAAQWYVDKNASGSNNGTNGSNAWSSFANVNWGEINAATVRFCSFIGMRG